MLWRIGTDTPFYEAHDMTGKGAELSGGRWNRAGTALVYASTFATTAAPRPEKEQGGQEKYGRIHL